MLRVIGGSDAIERWQSRSKDRRRAIEDGREFRPRGEERAVSMTEKSSDVYVRAALNRTLAIKAERSINLASSVRIFTSETCAWTLKTGN